MSFPPLDGVAMSRLWIDARLSSIASRALSGGVRVESADGADAAVSCVRSAGFHAQRYYGSAAKARIHSASLSVGLARAYGRVLDFSQHTVVSVRVVNGSLVAGTN